MSNNLSELSSRKGLKYNLFDQLGNLAIENGTPDQEELDALAEEFLIGKANTYGTITFYDFLKPENKGKKVYICNGTACLCAGTQEALMTKLKENFTDEEIGHMTCLGRCHENHAFFYKGKNYSGNQAQDISAIIKGDGSNEDEYHVVAPGPQILTRKTGDINAYFNTFRELLKKDRDAVLEEVKTSNLRGRGGAGFPMGLKLEYCKKQKGDTKFVICNADLSVISKSNKKS